MLLHFFRRGQFSFFLIILIILYRKMPGTQIFGRHVEVFRQIPLYLVLWAKIALGVYFFFTYDLYLELHMLIT